MRTQSLLVVFVGLSSSLALAQHGSATPPRAIMQQPTPTLKDEDRLKYICRAVQLDAQQQQHADSLIEMYAQERKKPLDLEQIRDMTRQLEEAGKAGDTAKQADLRARLQEMASPKRAEEEFFRNLDSVLNDSQRKALTDVRGFLERNPSGELRPADVLAIALGMQLSDQQKQKIVAADEKFRKDVNASAVNWPADKAKFLDQLVADVRGALQPQQQPEFDRQIEAMKKASAALAPVDTEATSG